MVIFHTVISRIFFSGDSKFLFLLHCDVDYYVNLCYDVFLWKLFQKIEQMLDRIYFSSNICVQIKRLPHSMYDSTNCIQSKSWIFLTITVQWFEPSLKASNPGPKFWNQNSTRIPNKVRTNKPPVNNLSFR